MARWNGVGREPQLSGHEALPGSLAYTLEMSKAKKTTAHGHGRRLISRVSRTSWLWAPSRADKLAIEDGEISGALVLTT